MTQVNTNTPAAPAALNEISKQWIDWLTAGGANAFAGIINKPEETNCKDALNRIPRFNHEDQPELTCLYMGFEASRFEEGQIQLCLYLYDRNNQRGGWWTGSLSQQYCKGNDAAKTYIQRTLEQLEKVGVTIENKANPNWMAVMQQIVGKTFPCWVAEKESKDTGRKYYIVQSLGVSDFPAPIAWPSAMGMMPAAPAQAAVIPQAQTMPAQPSAFAAPAATPAAPAAPAAPRVSVADIPQQAAQPQAGRVPAANPFFKPQA